MNNIESVVTAGLCTGCGTCVAVCPREGALSMSETACGLLFARVEGERCVGCGACLRSCGGAYLSPDLIPEKIDPFKGEVLSTYFGYAVDPETRQLGQSGGVVTALLQFMLESGRAEQALVNKMPVGGALRPIPFFANSKKDLRKSQGSKYCPVPLNVAIPKKLGSEIERLAIVGLPCHIHSIRNVQAFNLQWKNHIALTIGLFCDRTLAYGAIDYLIDKCGLPIDEAVEFRFRDKARGGWPGSILIRTRGGREIRIPSSERQAIKNYFTPPRCRLCFDKMNVLSDLAVGDAWGVMEGGEGYSVLIARTPRGYQLLEDARSAGILVLNEVEAEKIFYGQNVEARRQQWSAFTKQRRALRLCVPDHHIPPHYIAQVGDDMTKFAEKQMQWADSAFNKKNTRKIIRAIKNKNIIEKIKKIFILKKLKSI